MPETASPNLDGVAETLLLPLYIRALESKRPDAMLRDDKAITLIEKMPIDSTWMKQMMVDEDDKTYIILRNREFDRYAQRFLARFPQAAVVHIGCGLDSRFERVDNGQMEWYDLDLPEVIELRRKLIGAERERYHLVSCSVFDRLWLDTVKQNSHRPFLFLAEGVFMYFEEAQVKSLIPLLREHFPGAELVFDTFAPWMVRANNLRIGRTKIGARYHWGLTRGKDLEKWGAGIHLLDEWHYFDTPEPRLAHIRWMRFIPFLANVAAIFHYELGATDKPA